MAGGPKIDKYENLIIALLSSPDIQTAAQVVGISEGTAWRWMKQEKFQELYRAAKKQAVSQAIARIQQATGEAVETLRAVASDESAPASARVSAAKSILDTALKAVELEDVITRIEELERIAQEREKSGK